MQQQSLFPSRAAGGAGGGGKQALVSFNAGLCVIGGSNSNGKINVTADPRKGKITLGKGNDGQMHFKWTDRMNGQCEVDRMVFPGDVDFKKAKTGREHDRVYLLKFVGTSQRLMFWMQDKSSDKDQDNCAKINEYANDRAAADRAEAALAAQAVGEAAAGGGAAGGPRGANEQMMQQMMAMAGLPPGMANMPGMENLMQAMMQRHGGLPGQPADPAAAAAAAAPIAVPAPAPAAAAPAVDALAIGSLDLSSLLGQIGTAPAPGTGHHVSFANDLTSGSAQAGLSLADLQQAMARASGQVAPLSLDDIVTADGVMNSTILDDPAVVQALIAQLPEGQQTEMHLRETLHCPQFQQALRSLSSAAQSDNFSSIMASLSIDPSPGMPHMVRGDNVRALLTAIQASFPPAVSAEPEPVAAPASAPSSESSSATEPASSEGGDAPAPGSSAPMDEE